MVQLTIDAHGDFERWRRFEHVSAHLEHPSSLIASLSKRPTGPSSKSAHSRVTRSRAMPSITIDLSEVTFT